MKRYRLTGTLLSPLVVRKERQSQRSEGVTSLSGTLVRGALAQVYLDQRGAADDLFYRLFVDEEVCRFGPLDPGENTFPLSAASCKREGGFLAENKHGMVDLLWLRIARRLLGRELLDDNGLPHGVRCAVAACDQDLKAKDGFWQKGQGEPREAKGQWRRGADAHVGIDRYLHSAHEAILYSLPVLEPREQGASLTGLIEASDEEVEQLRHLLEDEDGEVRIGHARTRGYGRLRLKIGSPQPALDGDLAGWSEALIGFLAGLGAGLPAFDPARDFFFSVDLPTGALLLDSVLRYSLDLSGMVEWLPPLPPANAARPVLDVAPVPFEGGQLWCLGAITRHERLRGWNAAQGLPRQDEWLVSRGAVQAYLFRGDSAGRQALLGRLRKLQQAGVGARRGEGYGRVVVSDDFHHRFHRQETRA